jgi:hypothetical protein
MGAPKIKQLSALEAWALRRICFAKPVHEVYFKQCRPQVQAAISFVGQIDESSRWMVLQQDLLDRSVRAMLLDADEDSQPPADQERDWTIIAADQLRNLPPVTWLIEKEIPASGLTVLVGESGVGKSFVALDYSLRIAQQFPVVYMPTEGDAGYLKRQEAWSRFHHKGLGQLSYLFGLGSLMEETTIYKLVYDLAFIEPKLLVIDTLAMAMAGGDENSTRDMSLLLAGCRRLSRMTGTAVMLVHHVGKSGTERGSSALRGNADTMLRLNPHNDVMALECAKTKDEKPFATRYLKLIEVEVAPGTTSQVPVPAEVKPAQVNDPLTYHEQKILDFMSLETTRDGVTISEIAEFTQISRTTVHRALSKMVRFKFVEMNGHYKITDAGLDKLGGTAEGKTDQRSTSFHDRSTSISPSRSTPLRDVPPKNAKKRPVSVGMGGTGGTAEREGETVPSVPLSQIPEGEAFHNEDGTAWNDSVFAEMEKYSNYYRRGG